MRKSLLLDFTVESMEAENKSIQNRASEINEEMKKIVKISKNGDAEMSRSQDISYSKLHDQLNVLTGCNVYKTCDFRFKHNNMKYVSFRNSAWYHISNIKKAIKTKRVVKLTRSCDLIHHAKDLDIAIQCNSKKCVFASNTVKFNYATMYSKAEELKD